MTIRDILGGGSWDTVSLRLNKLIRSKEEATRRASIRQRVELYSDKGMPHLVNLMWNTFEASENVRRLRRFASLALSNNITRRIIDAYSTVYIEPAKRTVDSVFDQVALDAEYEAVNVHQVMRAANALVNLTNDVVLWPYLRAGDESLALEVVTQDSLYWVTDPWHPKDLIGVVIDQFPNHPDPSPSEAHYLLITRWETVSLNKEGGVILETLGSHDYGKLPLVIIHRQLPVDGVCDWASGGDLPAAHLAYAWLEAIKLKEQKDGGKQATLQTPTSQEIARGQLRDSESIVELPMGAQFSVTDLSTDPGVRSSAQKDVLVNISAAWSIPPSILEGTFSVTSGYHMDLLRQPLREKRQEQVAIFRRAEKELAQLVAYLTRVGIAGWRIDFAEFTTPLSPAEEFELFLKKRTAWLTSTVDELRRQNPDLSVEQAQAKLAENLAAESVRIQAAQRLGANPLPNMETPSPGPAANGYLGGIPPKQ